MTAPKPIHKVAVGTTEAVYNSTPPYHPDTNFPELPFSDIASEPNPPYRLLRDLFVQLGYDREHVGTNAWNPLGELVTPGQTVLLNPNYVLHLNQDENASIYSTVTHPSVLRALVDYVYIALKGEGRIVIADAPDMGCDWDELMAVQRLDTIQEFYQNTWQFKVEVYDLRNFAIIDHRLPAYSDNRKALPGDPQGSVTINLGERSAFYGLPSENYYGADYDRTETIRHHQGNVHEYCISKTVLEADLFIAVPKMKVHKKVGVTLNLKGLVGTTTNKNCLVHYRRGSPREGGDQIADVQPGADQFVLKARNWMFDRFMARQNKFGDLVYKTALTGYRIFIKPFRHVSSETLIQDGGNWHGNDSAWRMTTDLARVLFFADREGALQTKPQRRFLCLVDGIIGGEGEGPLAPSDKPVGCFVLGEHPCIVDFVTTRLMGYDVMKIKQYKALIETEAGNFTFSYPEGIEVLFKDAIVPGETFFTPAWSGLSLDFDPHPGWKNHIEINP